MSITKRRTNGSVSMSLPDATAVAVTAIVPTFNRSAYLRKTIEALLDQSFEKSGYEIIVIDNCSTDDTREVVCEELKHAPNLRYVYEPRLGLSPARNRGM